MLPIFLVVLLSSTVLGATSCAPHLGAGLGYILLSRVAMAPSLEACTPADGRCANLDISKITPVSGQTYDICGNGKQATGKRCVGYDPNRWTRSSVQL